MASSEWILEHKYIPRDDVKSHLMNIYTWPDQKALEEQVHNIHQLISKWSLHWTINDHFIFFIKDTISSYKEGSHAIRRIHFQPFSFNLIESRTLRNVPIDESLFNSCSIEEIPIDADVHSISIFDKRVRMIYRRRDPYCIYLGYRALEKSKDYISSLFTITAKKIHDRTEICHCRYINDFTSGIFYWKTGENFMRCVGENGCSVPFEGLTIESNYDNNGTFVNQVTTIYPFPIILPPMGGIVVQADEYSSRGNAILHTNGFLNKMELCYDENKKTCSLKEYKEGEDMPKVNEILEPSIYCSQDGKRMLLRSPFLSEDHPLTFYLYKKITTL